MTADTLRGKLKDDDAEIRRAAAVACAMKDEKSFVPDLIEILDDPEPIVSRAAMAAPDYFAADSPTACEPSRSQPDRWRRYLHGFQ